jgi:hypothetical protein
MLNSKFSALLRKKGVTEVECNLLDAANYRNIICRLFKLPVDLPGACA